MFGYVQANFADLSPEEKARYQAVYCGLCRTLGRRYGQAARLGLTYDLTFLTILLSSLYEPGEESGSFRCLAHPWKMRVYTTNDCTAYAADMSIALVYFKCIDDWQDEHKLSRRFFAARLRKSYEKVRTLWPEKCRAIEEALHTLSRIERERDPSPDAAANCFGRLMEELFVLRHDYWEVRLRRLGNSLGRYIYLADAMADRKRDKEKGNYNPLADMEVEPMQFRSTLMVILGDASQAFEELPLVQDMDILRNILYSGLWLKYNCATQPGKKE